MNNNNQVSQDQADGKFDSSVKTNLKYVNAEDEVRQTEDASLPDKEYAFGEDNTDNEEYHDAEDFQSGDLADVFEDNSEEQ